LMPMIPNTVAAAGGMFGHIRLSRGGGWYISEYKAQSPSVRSTIPRDGRMRRALSNKSAFM
jgi:hypothetical protein